MSDLQLQYDHTRPGGFDSSSSNQWGDPSSPSAYPPATPDALYVYPYGDPQRQHPGGYATLSETMDLNEVTTSHGHGRSSPLAFLLLLGITLCLMLTIALTVLA